MALRAARQEAIAVAKIIDINKKRPAGKISVESIRRGLRFALSAHIN
ncbi:MAG: hypothetical protein JRH18_00875 [Deltaproteobacteria bacterium]|nr:hypothetical protein [Deltaproteobacteria bacterium]MBW2150200.1 hypothetical protein [Deltaproteobacteria bacterium]